MADVEEEIFLRAIFFLLLVHKRRPLQAQTVFKTLASGTDKLDFCPIYFKQLAFLFLFFFLLIFTVMVVEALISRNLLHKFLVTNVSLFNASHVYNK